MNCVSYDICVYHFWFCLCFFFPGVLFHSRVTGTCPVTTDLIMQVNVTTTTTTTADTARLAVCQGSNLRVLHVLTALRLLVLLVLGVLDSTKVLSTRAVCSDILVQSAHRRFDNNSSINSVIPVFLQTKGTI